MAAEHDAICGPYENRWVCEVHEAAKLDVLRARSNAVHFLVERSNSFLWATGA